jgi:hypothetical protein
MFWLAFWERSWQVVFRKTFFSFMTVAIVTFDQVFCRVQSQVPQLPQVRNLKNANFTLNNMTTFHSFKLGGRIRAYSLIHNKKNICSPWDTLPCDWEVRGHCMCKKMPVIPVNKVVDPKRVLRFFVESDFV